MIPVVFCSWKRAVRITSVIDSLLSQEGVEDEIRVFVWNNNYQFKDLIDHYTTLYPEGTVKVHHSLENRGGFGRFYMAGCISRAYDVDKVIFVDDDQIIGKSVISTFLKHFKKKQIASWWGYVFKGGYWQRERVLNGSAIHYAGTGGMISDISIFSHPSLYNCPPKYWFAEDLWLSFFANHVCKWDLIGIAADIQIDIDGQDQYHSMKSLKPEFLEYLRRKGWKI